MFTYSLLGEDKEKVGDDNQSLRLSSHKIGEILYQLRQNVSPSYVM